MKAEKIILSFVALLAGLAAAGGAFYLYQSTKTIPEPSKKTLGINVPSPTPEKSNIFVTVDKPKDEEVVENKTVTITGKTAADAVIIISTPLSEEVITPATNGDFSSSVTIDDGQNQIEVIAVAPNGEQAKTTRTITFSTENF